MRSHHSHVRVEREGHVVRASEQARIGIAP
jgi:hypothetical protein